jgi:ribonucleoside-triphosphate reductase (formate)
VLKGSFQMNTQTKNEVTDRMIFSGHNSTTEEMTISMEEIGELMLQHDKANANVPHTPESTTMALASILKKEYAMKRIFSHDVMDAHKAGNIHIHNLDMPDRIYSMQYSEVVMINGELWPIGNLFDTQRQLEVLEDRDCAIDIVGNRVTDIDKTVKIRKFIRHKNTKPMKFISLENGKTLVCTEDHPFTINGREIQAKDLREGDVLFTSAINEEEWMFRTNNVNGFELTADFGWLMGLFITDGCYDKSNCGTWIIAQNEGEILTKAINILDTMKIKYRIKDVEDSECKQIAVYSKEWVDLFSNTFGITKGSRYKCLPPSILKFNKDFIFGMISGIIDGDGCVLPDEYGCTINVGVASRSLTNQLQLVLEVLGVKTYCHMQLTDKVQVCNIHGKERTMKQNIPVFRMNFRTTEDVVKNICLDSIKLRNKNINKFTVYKQDNKQGVIKTIKNHPIIDEYVYDFTTESEHFLVNGIRVHNCSSHSPAYISKFGLQLPNQNSNAKPPKHPEVLLEQIVKFAATMQGHFSGAIGFDAVNMFIAPYIQELDETRIKQLAQILVFEFSQQATSRGGQATFSDLNFYWGIPKHYAEVNAVGPGGIDTGIPYKEYADSSNAFLRAIMEVYYEGDGSGKPFFFPKPDCHISEESVKNEEYMNLLGKVAAKQGSPYFIFDRGNDPSLAQCCRLRVNLTQEDTAELKEPWKLRFTALQNVSMNLPGIAIGANGNEAKFYENLRSNMELAGKAHMDKFKFIEGLLDMGNEGPLGLMVMNKDGMPYVRKDKMKFLIGMVGLNEAVQVVCGQQMHESKTAYMLGLKMMSQMQTFSTELSKELGFKVILEQTPAESTAYKFAKLDLHRYGAKTRPFIRGNIDTGEYYYTNSTQMASNASLSAIERVKMDGKFHPLIEAGSMTHVWLGEYQPAPESLAAFVSKTFYNTSNAQITFSPEYTTCMHCNKTARGLQDNCVYCGSYDVQNLTRISGYFSVIQNWNKGKMGELKDRYRLQV